MSNHQQQGNVNLDVSPLSEFFIGRTKANDRITRFQNGKREILSAAMKANGHQQGESKHVWYPKIYFEMLMEEMAINNANGIRVYFGEYDGTEGQPPAGQLGLIFVLTEQTAEGKNRDIMLEENPNYQLRYNKAKELGVALHMENEEAEKAFNICGPCPPACLEQEALFPYPTE